MCVTFGHCGCFIVPLGQRAATSFPGYWLKEMLIWGKGFVFVFLEKVFKVFDRGRPPEN